MHDVTAAPPPVYPLFTDPITLHPITKVGHINICLPPQLLVSTPRQSMSSMSSTIELLPHNDSAVLHGAQC
jgi:hypothetical protein